TMSMSELAQVVPSDTVDDALKFTYGLIVFGVVVFEPPLAAGSFSLREVMPGHHEARARAQKEATLIRETLSRMSGQGPAEILGLKPGSSEDAVRVAFEENLARFRRERFSEGVREAQKRDLDLIEAKITEAFFNLQLAALETEHRAARSGAGVQQVTEED